VGQVADATRQAVKCRQNARRAAQKLAVHKQSGPLVRRLHLTGAKTAGSRGPGHLPHPRLPSPLPCEFLYQKTLEDAPFKVNRIQLELLGNSQCPSTNRQIWSRSRRTKNL